MLTIYVVRDCLWYAGDASSCQMIRRVYWSSISFCRQNEITKRLEMWPEKRWVSMCAFPKVFCSLANFILSAYIRLFSNIQSSPLTTAFAEFVGDFLIAYSSTVFLNNCLIISTPVFTKFHNRKSKSYPQFTLSLHIFMSSWLNITRHENMERKCKLRIWFGFAIMEFCKDWSTNYQARKTVLL